MSYDVAQTFRKDQATGKVTLAGDGRKALTDADIGPHAGQLAVNNAHDPATLDLDFANGRYRLEDGSPAEITDPTSILSVTRASPKWVFGPNGVLREVPIDTLARDFDPVTYEPRGVLIEESRTNLITYSEDLTNAAWGKQRVVVSVEEIASPQGDVAVAKVVADSTDAIHYIFHNQAVMAGVVHTGSVFVKSAGSNTGIFRLQALSGNVSLYFSFDLSNESGDNGLEIEALGGGWYRLAARFTPDAGDGRLYIYPEAASGSYTGDGTSGIYVWGAQLEQGSTLSSYIPTTGAAVTRDADTVSRSLGAEFNPSEGTFFVEVDDPFTTGRACYFAEGNTDVGTSFGIGRVFGSINASVRDYSYTGNHIDIIKPANNFKAAMSYSKSLNKFLFAVNGVSASATPTGFANPSELLTKNALGGSSGPSFESKSVNYYPYAMTALELEALTTP